jgi:hypothetical protein
MIPAKRGPAPWAESVFLRLSRTGQSLQSMIVLGLGFVLYRKEGRIFDSVVPKGFGMGRQQTLNCALSVDLL